VAYLLFILANAALFVRPAELLPALGDLPIYLALIGSAILCNLQGLQTQVCKRTLLQQPVNLCVLGMCLAVPVSHLASSMYLAGAYHGFVAMFKVVLYYLMLVSVINTPQRLRQFMQVTALCGTIVVGASILDFQSFKARWGGVGETELFQIMQEDYFRDQDDKVLKHVVETYGSDNIGNTQMVFRMRGLGIFNDPNDVALLIAVSAVICVYFFADRELGAVRWAWVLPLFILGYGYIETQSRGGLMAMGAAGMVWLAMKYGRKTAMALGALGMLAAPLALGRAANMNVSDGSGQDRIQIWGEGLASLKSRHIFFGSGQGQYEEIAGHVAHNSYIHAFVELGYIGGTMFLGCFFLSAYAFYVLKRGRVRIEDAELRRMMPYIAAILAGWGVGIATLSRCYEASTYMVVGLSAAYINLAGYSQQYPCPIVRWNAPTVKRLAFCSIALLAASFVFVRLFARWGGA
jgi:hypothetical protein